MKYRKKKIYLAISAAALLFNFSVDAYSAPLNYGEALQKGIFFYDIQRIGKISQATGDLANRVYWRGDSFLQDYMLPNEEGVIDLGGGFVDAGDNVKFNFPMAASTTMLAWGVIEFKDAYQQSNQLKPMLANLRWATDYLLKCWDASHGRLYGQVSPDSVGAEHSNLWMPVEVVDQASIDKNLPRYAFYVDADHPGTDLAGETVAALAASAMAFQASDPTYANTLLTTAKNIYQTMVNVPNKGKYSDNMGRKSGSGWKKADVSTFYNSWSGYNDEVSWSAMWLYMATNDPAYMATAKSFIEFGHVVATQSWDDKSYGTYLLLAKYLPDGDPMKASAKKSAEDWLDSWANGTNGHVFSSGGLAIATALSPWGNARYAASTAFTALVYNKYFSSTRYLSFANKQIDYLLGNNNKQFSFQEGFGTKFPKRSHHATAQGRWGGNNDVQLKEDNRHIAYGALVGGPKDTSDTYDDDRNDYIGNEIALDYNAGFVGALAALYGQFGGNPLSTDQFPPTRVLEKPPVDEIFVNGGIQSSQKGNNQSTIQVSLLATNHTAWPARVTKNLKLKYFLNLADKPADGTVKVNTFSTDPRAVISPLKLYDAANQIYYVEVWFKDIPIYPGGDERAISSKETQLQFQFSWAHDFTKDWSYQGLGSGNSPKSTQYVPIYEVTNTGEKLLYGQEPTSQPQGNLTLKFAADLPAPCLGAKDNLQIGPETAVITLGTQDFTYGMTQGSYPVSLNSATTPIVVNGGSCKGGLSASQVAIPGELTATYTYTEAPPPEKGTLKLTLGQSDPKCDNAVDTLLLDQDAGRPFTVSADGTTVETTTGTHTVKLASQTSIPAKDLPGYCTSTLDKSQVDIFKDKVSNVMATYQYHDVNTGMSCTIVESKVTQQSDWGSGLVNTFSIKVNLSNFPQDQNGKVIANASFVMKNNFIQNFWGNFNMLSSSFQAKNGSFKGELWPSQLPFVLGGFVDNKTTPLKVGDNPMQTIVIDGITCQ